MRQGLNELIRWRARATPELPALWYEGREWTFRDLDARSSQVADALVKAGVKRGDRVAVLDKNSDRYLETVYGIGKAGAIFVPVNWRQAAPEVAYVLQDCGAEILFYGSGFADVLAKARPGVTVLKRTVCFDTEYEAFFATGKPEDPRRDLGEHDTAWIFYTSGTTGKPKGVEITEGNLTCILGSAPSLLGGMREEEVLLSFLPLFHIAGAGLLNICIVAGLKLVMMKEFDPGLVLELIPRHKINHALMVPAIIQTLLHDPRSQRADFSSLRCVLYGAAPISEEVLKGAIELFDSEFIQLYGLTETAGGITRLRFADHLLPDERAVRLTSCGQPLMGMEARIVTDDGRPLPSGDLGHIEVKGPRVMKGYWGLPEATAEVIRDGWFRTGDLGFIDRDGFIYIRDRAKDLIISGGENIASLEVENCLASHPAVAEVAVIGVPDPKWGESVKAVVALKAGKEATAEELIAFCQDRIAAYKKPRSVDFIKALPRNAGGKVLKRELRRPFWEGHKREVH